MLKFIRITYKAAGHETTTRWEPADWRAALERIEALQDAGFKPEVKGWPKRVCETVPPLLVVKSRKRK